jgi:uncharacterized delta-60 repeat protein
MAGAIGALGLVGRLPTPAWAAPGDLDPAFGDAGVVAIGFPAISLEGRAVAVQKDGRIVVAASLLQGGDYDFSVWGFKRNGSRDTRFGDGGGWIVRLPGEQIPRAMALQRDGKIVVAGSAFGSGRNQFMVARFNRDGSPDTSFLSQGYVMVLLSDRHAVGAAVAIQKDQKIVVAGWTSSMAGEEFALLRLHPTGAPDATFDGDAVAITDFNRSGNEDHARAVAVQKDGKILAAGYSNEGSDGDFALARYLPNGALDPSFDGDGRLTTDLFFGDDIANAVRIQKDGRILAAGRSEDPGGFNFALARYLRDGSPDPAFGEGAGRLSTSFALHGDEGVTALALQKDGRIVAGGYAEDGPNRNFAVARYRKGGALDSGFGGTGAMPGGLTTDVTDFDHAQAVALQKDGKIVVTGYTGLPDRNLVLIRYLGR